MKKPIKIGIMLVLLAVIILVTGLISGYAYNWNFNNGKKKYESVVIIEKNSGVRVVLTQLGIKNKMLMRLYLRYRKIDNKLKAGNYQLSGEYTLNEIFEKFTKGDYEKVKVVVPEGFTLKQIKNRLLENGLIDELKFDEELQERRDFYYLPLDGNFEGFFFPDTYYISRTENEGEIIDKFLNRFLEKYPVEKYRDKNDFYKRLIMASIVEKEAYFVDEKPIIASVFYNRIKKGIRLGSCATVEYLYDYKKGKLYYKDLEIVSPYNTYKNKGLPPAPISNPGEKSIEAALNPANTEYLFFVADSTKRHTFSKEYKDHLKAKSEIESKKEGE